MKLLRVWSSGSERIAVERGSRLVDVTEWMPRKRADLGALIAGGPQAWKKLRERVEGKAGAELPVIGRRGLRVLAPLRRPGKIVCIGRNYLDHCREQNAEPPKSPMLFAKFANTLLDPGAAVAYPPETHALDYEGELVVVIGVGGKRIAEDRALDHVFGYSILNDISARDLQKSDGQWLRAKGADGFAPFGPAILTADEVADPQGLTIRTTLNGEVVQDSSTREMIFPVRHLVSFVSALITLEAGDLISTGTPAGVGAHRQPPRMLRAGDVVRVEIPPIGVLENAIVSERV